VKLAVRPDHLARSFLLVLGLLGAAPAAYAQGFPPTGPDTLRETSRVVPSPRTAVPSRSSLVDVPVRRGEYRLGPGDGVELAVVGERAMLYSLTVGPEGTMVVPSLGMVDVLGLTIDHAESLLRQLVSRFYTNVEVHLALSEVRSFKVFVLGDVSDPGVRNATATTRVSELVQPSDSVIRRFVRLRRASGDSVAVDLLRFMQLGDLSANPTVMEGDALLIPPIDATLHVLGQVGFPGEFEYRSGETLSELLNLVTGGAGLLADAGDSVYVSRTVSPDRRESFVFSVADALHGAGSAFLLRPFDAVFVPSVGTLREPHYATATGELRRPGAYPIRPGETTLRELVTMAGGFTREASLVDAQLLRPRANANAQLLRPRANANAPREQPAADDYLSPTERQIARISQQSSGDPWVVVDFERLFIEGVEAYDQPLLNGDVLVVPGRPPGVRVLGAVPRPGLIAHEPGHSVLYYVQLAGGYARRADRRRVAVLRAGTGTRLDAREVDSVRSGDSIIVPYSEHRTFSDRMQAVQGVLGVVTTLLLTATLLAGTR
jgi:polysaccharide biosynthesis/export protein